MLLQTRLILLQTSQVLIAPSATNLSMMRGTILVLHVLIRECLVLVL